MTAATAQLVNVLDELRFAVMRRTLRFAAFRQIYSDRAARHMMLFLLAVVFYLPLTVFFPLYVLAIGPLLWGVPHLFASARFIERSLAPTHSSSLMFRILMALFVIVTSLRLCTDVLNLPWALEASGKIHYFAPELLAVIATFVAVTLVRKQYLYPLKFLGSLLFVGAFLGLVFQYPLESAGVLLIAHNFVAFFYWISNAPSRRDFVGATAALIVFSLITIAIFAGAFDHAYSWFQPQSYLPWANLNYETLGRSIVPWSDHYQVWFHGVVAYAFGQAVHYFVWMKAIPEVFYRKEIPPTFRQSWWSLERDIGAKSAVAAVVLCLAAAATYFLGNFAEARVIYFAMASCHGFSEIAGLGFLRTPRWN